MKKINYAEKRQHPRADLTLPVQIAANGYGFETTTQNISAAGAYCCIDKYIPPFTRVAVKMTLPIVERNKKQDCNVECSGVVVRSVDHAKQGFNVAIFFNDIKESQRKKISHYINQFLPQASLAASR